MKIIADMKYAVLVVPFTILAIIKAKKAASYLLMVATTERV